MPTLANSVYLNKDITVAVTVNSATPVVYTITSQVQGVGLEMTSTVLDKTTYGNTWEQKGRGLKTGTITFDLFVDFDAAGINYVFSTLWGTYDTVPFVVTANAKTYTGTFVMSEWKPFDGGAAGEYTKASMSFPLAGAVTIA